MFTSYVHYVAPDLNYSCEPTYWRILGSTTQVCNFQRVFQNKSHLRTAIKQFSQDVLSPILSG